VFAQNLASVLASTLLNANTKTFSARQVDRAEHLCEYLLGGGTLEFVVLQTGCEEFHFSDGARKDCWSSDSALRLIAYRHRVAVTDLVTDRTEERILVWIYPGEKRPPRDMRVRLPASAYPGTALCSRRIACT
jgi:hypothetical protein